MKNTILITLLTCSICFSYGQINYSNTVQEPAAPFTARETVYKQDNPNVWITISYSIAGYKMEDGRRQNVRSYYKVESINPMKNVIHFKFDFMDYDAKVQTKRASIDMSKPVTANWFDYFFGTRIVKGPYDISFNDNEMLKANTKKTYEDSEKELDKKIDEDKKSHPNRGNQPRIKSTEGGGGRRADNTTTNPQVETMAVTSSQTPQQLAAQQKQKELEQRNQQLNTEAQQYLDNAANATTATSKAYYLGMAKINATATGDNVTIQKIESEEKKQKDEMDSKLITATGDLINLLTSKKSTNSTNYDKLEERRERKEKEKIEEEKRRQEEIKEQWEYDQKVLGKYIDRKKNTEIPQNVKQVFFITYERVHLHGLSGYTKIKTYAINQYSDGSWMLQTDILNKLNFEEITFHTDTTKLLVGFFTSKQEILNLVKSITESFYDRKVSMDNSFIELNSPSNKAPKKDDFWNN